MRVVRDVFRRKGRSLLTIFGITIGVLALVVMGSMAEKIDKLFQGGVAYYQGKVTVADADSKGNFGVSIMQTRTARDLRSVDGVAAVSSVAYMLYEENEGGVSFGQPPLIWGQDFEASGHESFGLTAREGRLLRRGDHGAVVVGADLALKEDVGVGDTLEIRDERFQVVGILEKTLTAPDTAAYMSLPDAQDLLYATLPGALRTSVDRRSIVTEMVVYPQSGVDPDALARRINRKVAGVTAAGPTALIEMARNTTSIFSSIVIGIALVSLMVGGLSVVNTMMMSVSERVREIGIRKAVGASTANVVIQFLGESAVIGVAGGLAGLGLGAAIVAGAKAAGAASGTLVFLLTPRLAIGAVAFATALGMAAGLYPAVHAAGLDPVVAFRRG